MKKWKRIDIKQRKNNPKIPVSPKELLIFPRKRESFLSELFYPIPKKPNPDSGISLFT